ncbi:thioredoxin [Breoghania sp. L-A4]|uniref:thioredoxin n=1 Tax=Breoghania sp. L-A4 TaxID=2304600 RepID=UPI000E35EBCE|nr:thioredoxin [Breoghania sp. L-A4]AXS38798.1 thioredoxin [Breoghania sp. L-A4]
MNEPTYTLGANGALFGGETQADDGLIKDTTTQAFMADVIEESSNQPVLIDFWAPWCGPCKQLTPVIEKAVRNARGAVKLVKMNIDEHPEIPGQMGVQSIPAVVAFKDGRPLDGFMGAQTESQVQAFIERIAGPVGPSEADQMMEQAEAARAEGNWAVAAQAYVAVLQAEPDNAAAMAGLAHCYVGAGDLDRATQTLAAIAPEKANDPAVTAAKAALELAEQADKLGDLAELQARVASQPDDHQARFDLAVALSARGDKTDAVDQLMEIIVRDREWNEDGARKQLVQFFEAWGFKDPAAAYGRRKLSAVLFS